MFRYSKAVVYTVIAILLCGLPPLWLIKDPALDTATMLRMTVGCIFAVSYLLYRHVSCVQRVSLEQGHLYMEGRDKAVHAGREYKMVYRSTFLVFAGFQIISRAWRPETGMIVYRNTTRYVPFMSLFDRIFPASNANRQVLFFGAWKRASGEVVPDGDIQRQIESSCAQEGLAIKDVSIEPELLACVALVMFLAWIALR